jgi:hypothetical protein
MDLLTILAALAPLAVDAGKALIGRFIGADFKPANVADWLAMKKADLEQFQALNNAGGANPSYPWVEAIVRLQRPIVGAAVLSVWAYSRTVGVPSESIDNFASAIGFYLFGDRTLFYIRNVKK